MSGTTSGDGTAPSHDEPDAVGRGWIERNGVSREQALFLLAGPSLGVGDPLGGSLPEWYDLHETTNLDALGDPVAGMQPVEMQMSDGRVLRAGWPLAFCDSVVEALHRTLPEADRPDPATEPTAVADAAPAAESAPPSQATAAPVPAAPVEDTAPTAPEAWDASAAAPTSAPAAAVSPPSPAPAGPAPHAPVPDALGPASTPASPTPEDDPAAPTPEVATDGAAPTGGASPEGVAAGGDEPADPTSGAAALVLEDVIYLGGYPGLNKKRKKCTATLTRQAVEVSGPNGLSFRVPWDVVRTIEAQNADEARFRMNTKVHRDATALVLECDQDVTVLLEARDCPTIPLRGAIAQLVGDMQVVVV